MVIKKGKEDIYEKKDENITSKTKEEILKELLIELHDNYKGNVIKLKINYKQFTKFYNTLKAKYEEFLKGDNNNAKLHKEISKDIKLLETKDTIIIEE